MKQFKSIFFFLVLAIATSKIIAQVNPSIAILPVNAGGVVAVGATMDIKVTITNTGTGNVVAFKLRPNITIPPIASILPTAEQTGLPAGWSVVTNTGNGQIRICNGTDVIAGGDSRDVLIKVQGVTIGGPSQCEAQINFGGASCAVTGPQPSGNNGIDDFATSSVTVISGPLPVTLLSFHAILLNCQPSLKWETESEINTDRFEIESTDAVDANWKKIGEITANGTLSKSSYNFPDASRTFTSERVFYRLKMIDKDGHYKYSEILPLFVDCKTIQSHVYPNPVQDGKLYVSLSGAEGKITGKLLAITGQTISSNTLSNGTNYLNVSGVANGTYILQISSEAGFDQKLKVIIHQ
jgi:hypothetical protein